MTDLRHDPVDAEIREALQALHARVPASCFARDWAAAQAAAEHQHEGARAVGPLVSPPYRPWVWTAVAAVVVLTVGVVLRVTVPVGVTSSEPDVPVSAAPDTAAPVMWYSPTDELLQVQTLEYTARPAMVTHYDPIRLEVRP